MVAKFNVVLIHIKYIIYNNYWIFNSRPFEVLNLKASNNMADRMSVMKLVIHLNNNIFHSRALICDVIAWKYYSFLPS